MSLPPDFHTPNQLPHVGRGLAPAATDFHTQHRLPTCRGEHRSSEPHRDSATRLRTDNGRSYIPSCRGRRPRRPTTFIRRNPIPHRALPWSRRNPGAALPPGTKQQEKRQTTVYSCHSEHSEGSVPLENGSFDCAPMALRSGRQKKPASCRPSACHSERAQRVEESVPHGRVKKSWYSSTGKHSIYEFAAGRTTFLYRC